MLRFKPLIKSKPQLNTQKEKKMKSARFSKLITVAMVAAFPAVLWAQGETQVADSKTVPPTVETKAPAGDTARPTRLPV